MNTSEMTANGNSTDGMQSASSFSWTLFLSLGLVWIPGIVCNIIALVSIIRDIKTAVCPAIFLLLILVCCDLTAVIFSTLNQIVVFYIQNVTHPVCVFLATFYVFFRVASALMNLIMAVDRYLAICQPFYYTRNVTVKTWAVTCLIVCLSILVYCMFPVMGLGDVKVWKTAGTVRCSSLAYALKPTQRVFGMMFPLIGSICTLTLVVLNMIVIRELVRLKNRVGAISLTLEGSSSTDTSGNAIAAAKVKPFEVKFAKLMACLSTVYLVCGTPYNTLVLVNQFDDVVSPAIVGPMNFLAAIIFTVDPIVYIIVRKANWKRVREMVCRFCLCDRSNYNNRV